MVGVDDGAGCCPYVLKLNPGDACRSGDTCDSETGDALMTRSGGRIRVRSYARAGHLRVTGQAYPGQPRAH